MTFKLILIILCYFPALANEKRFKVNQDIALWIDRQARSLDLALSGKRYTDELGDSRAILSQEFFWDEQEDFDYRLDFDLDLALPNFEKKYKLMISNYNRNKVKRSNYSRGQFREDRRDDYGATLRFFQRIGDFDVSFEPRIEIKNGIATFYTLSLESESHLWSKNSKFKTRFEFFADSERGTGQFVAFVIQHTFFSKWAHSLVFEEEYQDADNILSFLYGYTIHYDISHTMTLNQSFVFTSDNDESNQKLKQVTVGPSFTHLILKDEIHYSINYDHIFERELDFKGYPSVSLILSFVY